MQWTTPGVPLALALLSALCWAGLDATRKRLTKGMSPLSLVTWMTAGQGAGMLVWAFLEGRWVDGPAYVLPGAASLLLNVVANLLFVQAVRVSPLSLTVPYLALSPAFAALIAIATLGEHPSPSQWLGVAIVVAGALVLNAQGTGGGLGAALKAFLRERGSVYMTLVAALWAVTMSVDKIALRYAGPAVHGLVQTAGVSCITAGWLAVSGQWSSLASVRGHVRWLLAAIALGGIALGAQLVAITGLLVSLVETLKRAVGLVMAIVIGRLWFGEPVTWPRVLGVLAMGAGAALVLRG